MPRPTRLVMAGQAHHVLQRGNNRQPVFFDDEGRRLYLRWLGEAAASEGCALHAYALMTNHVHLMLMPARAESISRLMQSVGRRYVGYVNRAHGRTGTLWEGRYKSTVLDSETYVLACQRYIEANPLRAAMVTRAEDYPWSSYRFSALGDLFDRAPECRFVGPRGRREAAQFPDELQGRGADFFLGRRRGEILERSNVPTHWLLLCLTHRQLSGHNTRSCPRHAGGRARHCVPCTS
jgi:REP element-mobilizing transposase RayT